MIHHDLNFIKFNAISKVVIFNLSSALLNLLYTTAKKLHNISEKYIKMQIMLNLIC